MTNEIRRPKGEAKPSAVVCEMNAWRSHTAPSIPKGLQPSAQGCEARATLGESPGVFSTLKGLSRSTASERRKKAHGVSRGIEVRQIKPRQGRKKNDLRAARISVAPLGLPRRRAFTHGLRRGLFSCAPSGLGAAATPSGLKTIWFGPAQGSSRTRNPELSDGIPLGFSNDAPDRVNVGSSLMASQNSPNPSAASSGPAGSRTSCGRTRIRRS